MAAKGIKSLPEFNPSDAGATEWELYKRDFIIHLDALGLDDKPGRRKVGVLLSNIDALTGVLTYHVSPGKFDPRLFVPPVKRPTLQGNPVVFHRQDGHPQVNQANVSCQGVQTSNGRVWLIDKVLLPLF